ncbi:MAG: hypothetical protein V7745_04120 [Pseudomonadales bacterium]
MGIVVCITLLLGLLSFLQNWRTKKQPSTTRPTGVVLAAAPQLLLAMGLWNVGWYGLRHLGSFWGNAALFSGVTMLLAGLLLYVESKRQTPASLLAVYRALKPLRLVIITALLASFLLYAITLIQLNLGYAIIH